MSEQEATTAVDAADNEQQQQSPKMIDKIAADLDNTQLSDNATNQESSAATAATAATANPDKIEIIFKAVGNAPILKKKKFLLERHKNVHFIVNWLKKYMKLDLNKDQLFLYVNQEFAPSPDVEIGTLYDCFKAGTNVILHYSVLPAWG